MRTSFDSQLAEGWLMHGAVADALKALSAHECVTMVAAPDKSGLYAVYASESGRRDLTLPPGDLPVYVGKAEKSLASRDLDGHFHVDTTRPAKTGTSTLRRSLAALLRDQLDLVPLLRSTKRVETIASFSMSVEHDLRLTEWMHHNLTLAMWAPEHLDVPLRDIESTIIDHWQPPLNSKHVAVVWPRLRAARAAMVADARSLR